MMFGYTYSSNNQIENENRLLKETINRMQDEINKFNMPALMVCDIVDILDDKAIVKTPNGNRFFVNISNQCDKVSAGDTVVCEQKNLTILNKIPNHKRFNVESFVIIEKPEVRWEKVGGLKPQVDEIKEVIELPLKNPELFKKVGINPPKGILLQGPPGTGKTLLAKAVASSTNSTFIEIVGSELVQKFIGEGAKLVKEIFILAKEKAPSIVFIDEIDAIAAKRIDLGTSGEREVQRTFMQLLAELDGFKSLDNVKIIGCTNRMDILDPAILRPGRLDRLIEVPLPNEEGIKEIFLIHTAKMHLDKNIIIDAIIKKMKDCSGADVQSIATEAGYFAIRDERTKVTARDFVNAIAKVRKSPEKDMDLAKMFG
jgi:proteasome regulatory subunit